MEGYILGTVTAVGQYAGDVLVARMNIETKAIECKYYAGQKRWMEVPTGSRFAATFKGRDFTKKTGRYS